MELTTSKNQRWEKTVLLVNFLITLFLFCNSFGFFLASFLAVNHIFGTHCWNRYFIIRRKVRVDHFRQFWFWHSYRIVEFTSCFVANYLRKTALKTVSHSHKNFSGIEIIFQHCFVSATNEIMHSVAVFIACLVFLSCNVFGECYVFVLNYLIENENALNSSNINSVFSRVN